MSGDGFMRHDPLAEVDDLPSAADDILEGELLPAAEREGGARATAEAGEAEVDLGDALTIREVAEVHDRMLAAMGSGAEAFRLKAAALGQVDGAGLQMLAAFLREAGQRGQVVRWDEVPEALREGAARLGLTTVLGLA